MSNLDSLEREKARLEMEIAAERRRAQEKEKRQLSQAVEAFEKTRGVHVNISDDYAVLDVGRHGPVYRTPDPDRSIRFYFGYEETQCAIHGPNCGCGDEESAFVVTESGKETMRLGQSSLHPQIDEVEESLLCGIGMWIAQRLSPASPYLEREG